MKHIATVILGTLTSISLSANPIFDMNDLNVRINSMVSNKVHLTNSAVDVEGRNVNADFIAVKNLALTSWSQIIDQMDSIAHGSDGQKLVIDAFQALDATDFMSAFEKLVTKFEADSLTKDLMTNALIPDQRMQTFFAYNFQHPRVIAALERIRNKVSEDDPLAETVNNILSGDRKASYESYRLAHLDTTDPPKEIILLSPSP